MDAPAAKRRWFRFRLRGLFVAIAVAGILTALLVRLWQQTHARLEYVNHAGEVNGHVRTMQGYRYRVNRWRLAWWLFGDRETEEIWLYPDTYSDDDLAYIRGLFPEAKIADYAPSD